MQRVVMGKTADGGTVYAAAAVSGWTELPGLPGVELAELWSADAEPDLPAPLRLRPADLSQPLPQGATSFRIVRVEPGSGMAMHATDTIDYLVIQSGAIVLQAEDGAEVLMQSGDCVVQLGGRHAWHNRGTVPCVMSAVIVGARARTPPALPPGNVTAGQA